MSDNDIGARLLRLENIEAIKALKAKYFNACDRKDTKAMLACFKSGDVHIDFGAIGVFNKAEDLIKVFTEMAVNDFVFDTHHGQNPEIELLNDSQAKATWGLYFYQINTQENALTQLSGCYQDEYEKVDGEWLMTSSVFTVNSTIASQISEGDLKVLHAGPPPPLP